MGAAEGQGRGRGSGRGRGAVGGFGGTAHLGDDSNDWQCPQCSNVNFARRPCYKCGALRPGDWRCPQCPHVNFARRSECHKCGAPRPGGAPGGGRGRGRGAPDASLGGPPGKFVQGDWPCLSCGNVNWERRSSCNKCGIEKPKAAVLEKREGAGGGFNERQDASDIVRRGREAEVDADGYDEFGRKAKTKAADRKAREAAALARLAGSTLGASVGMGGAAADARDDDDWEPPRAPAKAPGKVSFDDNRAAGRGGERERGGGPSERGRDDRDRIDRDRIERYDRDRGRDDRGRDDRGRDDRDRYDRDRYDRDRHDRDRHDRDRYDRDRHGGGRDGRDRDRRRSRSR